MKPIYKATWITFITIPLNIDWFLVLICGRILVFLIGLIKEDTHQIGVAFATIRSTKRRQNVGWALQNLAGVTINRLMPTIIKMLMLFVYVVGNEQFLKR